MNTNVIDLFTQQCRDNPARVALISPLGDEITYGALGERVDSLAAGLSRAGLRAGDRAVIMIPMSRDLYVTLLAIFKMGAIGVFVDPWLSMHSISAFAAFSEPKAFIGIPKSHILRVFQKRLWNIEIGISTKSLCGIPTRRSLAALQRFHGTRENHTVDDTSTALITFTSGSSGTPKGANRTHGFLRAQHNALSAVMPYREDDVDLCMFPVFALNNLACGITTVIPDMDFKAVAQVNAATIHRQMITHQVTTCTVSPPLVDRLVEYIRSTGKGIKTLRRVTTGGAPISNAMLRRWRATLHDTEIMVVYGSTEAEPIAHISLEERLTLSEDTPGYCMGHFIPQVRARLITIAKGPVSLRNGDWSSLEVQPGEVGELVVTGDHVCKDYYRNQSATTEIKLIDSDGSAWHRMGDTGYFDRDGRFWLTGRVHSTIHRDGLLIHPQLVEQAIKRELNNESLEVAALGVPSPQLGESLVIVTSDPVDPALVEAALVRRGITADRVITQFPPLPKDPRHNSKIDYGKLRDALMERA